MVTKAKNVAAGARVQNRVSYLQGAFGHEDIAAETRATWALSCVAIDGAVLNHNIPTAVGDAAAGTREHAGAASQVAADCAVGDGKRSTVEDTPAYAAALKATASRIGCDGAVDDVQRPAIADTAAETGLLRESASDEVVANSGASDLH
ncbi:MAG: hypothetical protein DME64_13990 [Verrucomicrobia bacterium]|nr:MAG: hypothetical protein DME64_13990 [Verrucomicrobiota bacterium]